MPAMSVRLTVSVRILPTARVVLIEHIGMEVTATNALLCVFVRMNSTALVV